MMNLNQNYFAHVKRSLAVTNQKKGVTMNRNLEWCYLL